MLQTQFFQKALLSWFSRNKRSLPWRKTTNPYKILVSEVMLQQTQVDRVKGYYARFLKQFPTAAKLAKAKPAAVLKCWSGLGYNRRALLLQKTAQAIVARGGKFPKTEAELRELPGIGPYTAGAVLAFAYNKDATFADTNVVRVIERFFSGIKSQRKEHIAQLLHTVLPSSNARNWYSALMDFGSEICISRVPKCAACPLRKYCKAAPHFLRGVVPRKLKASTEKFEGSNRWWRGKILKALLNGAKGEAALYRGIVAMHGLRGKRVFAAALASLIAHGVVRKINTRYAV